MRVNVGLVTAASLRRPEATPLTKCVLPAPRSPQSASTSPRRSVAAMLCPCARVSSTLCEMVVATGQFWFAGFARRAELADARERQARESPLPGSFQSDADARIDREE